MSRTAFVHAGGGPSYNLGDDHPMTPLRRRLAVDLIKAYGLHEHPDVVPIAPGPAVRIPADPGPAGSGGAAPVVITG